MSWSKTAGFLLPLLGYCALVYDAVLPAAPSINAAIAFVGFILGGAVVAIIITIHAWLAGVSDAYGSARFASPFQVAQAGLYGKRGVLLGTHHGRLLRFDQPGHLLTLAPTRAGKGTCAVIPNLLDHPGSTVVVDIKGENFAIAGRRRADFGRVLKFAPFEADSHRFNPLDFIREGEDAWDDAAMLADMLIVPSGAAKSVFFENEARALLTGLILYVVTQAPPIHRNLTTVRHLVTLSGDALDYHLQRMQRARHPIVRRVASSFIQKEEKLRSNILAEIQTHTLIWDSTRVSRVTARSDFSMDDLKAEPTSLFLIIPPEFLGVYRPLLRLMLGLATRAMTHTPAQPKHPVLFLVDEFPTLGHMKPIHEGVAYLAGYGAKLWLFAQDLGQLESVYGESGARTLIANTSLQAFNNTDDATLDLLSKMLGTATVRVNTKSKTRRSLLLPDYDSFNVASGETSRPLLTPDEIRTLGDDKALLFVKGARPVLATKEPYFKARRFRGLWDRWTKKTG